MLGICVAFGTNVLYKEPNHYKDLYNVVYITEITST